MYKIESNKLPNLKFTAEIEKPENYTPILIKSSSHAAEVLKTVYPQGELCLCENFYIIAMNQRNEVIAVLHHSKGAVNSTVVDPKAILRAMVMCGAQAFILTHNHPSGNLKPSEADSKITKNIKTLAETFELTLLDHIIISHEGYYSFADNGW